MALKQLLFADNSLDQLPSIIHLIQSGVLPDSELTDVFSNISNLIYGTFTQRKIGLAVLKCCLLHLYKTNRMTNNIDYLLKWWKGVVNCMKSRYTPDCTYRLACTNAVVLSQTCGSYVDLLIEGRANVPVMVAACISHVCNESFDLLLVLAQTFPSHIGKHYDDVKSFCLSHVQDEYCDRSAEIFAQLTCVGPAGKQSANYTQSWNRTIVASIENMRNHLYSVVSHEVVAGSSHVFQNWQFLGTIEDVVKANKEISFLSRCIMSLLKISIEVSTVFPLKSYRTLVEAALTAFSESQIYTATTENFTKKLVINHTVGEILAILNSTVSVLKTTMFLIQPEIESLLYSLLQQSCHVSAALNLLSAMVNIGCTITSLPFVVVMDLLTLNSLHIKGPVTKKQKTEQFSTFTFETSTLGAHNEEVMITVLKLLNQVLKSYGTSLSQFKVDILRTKCTEILANKESFSSKMLQHTYEVLNTLSSQSFDHQSVLSLSSSTKNATLHTFFCNEIQKVEPHLHPERYSFRSSAGSESQQSSPLIADNHMPSVNKQDDFWEKENDVLFEQMPHNVGNGADVSLDNANADDVDMEEKLEGEGDEEVRDHESGDSESEQSDEESEENPFEVAQSENTNTLNVSSAIPKSNVEVLKVKLKNSNEISLGVDDVSNYLVEEKPSEQLQDILSLFVDEPASGDEM